MTILLNMIVLPLAVGILLLLIPDRFKLFKALSSLIIASFVFYFSILLFTNKGAQGLIKLTNSTYCHLDPQGSIYEFISNYFVFRIDDLSKLIALFIGLFTCLIIIYCLTVINRKKHFYNYYAYLMLTLGASNGAALTDNLMLFFAFWSFLGITLYKLVKGHTKESAQAAKKSLIMIGGSDALMLIGIGIIWQYHHTINISQLSIFTYNTLPVIAFLTLLIGSFTKAGAFPFHSWIPEFTQRAHATSSAYLPASLDKLLGIYFMYRICNEIFILNQWLRLLILISGVATIIIGVMMALVQHNCKKLLGYHAVSQVGYMITGLGLGTPLGIIGGLFHMINNAIYKSGLFLVAGSVKKQTSKEDIDKLGGLSGKMPITFITALIFALSISGIPPLNGFASKWIIYQAIIDFGKGSGLANELWMVWLVLAVIGSALTLASFIKFISGIFLSKSTNKLNTTKEANTLMLIPMIILAIICVIFGVFATTHIIPYFLKPVVGNATLIGHWDSITVSSLILFSLILGVIVYAIGILKNSRREESYLGGEQLQKDSNHAISEFYDTIKKAPFLSGIYKKAQANKLDIYYLCADAVRWLNQKLSIVHDGRLPNYAFWLIGGLIIMLLLLI
ncbi:MAG: NADH dehydrogenase [Marinilabiliaceae bacterium]|nr:NADH dehydrogenase [Marinilabiliaceae bacterium]